MLVRVVCFAGFLSLAVGCAPSPRSEVVAPAPAPRLLDLTTLSLPTVDSATLASLGALLDSLQRSSARTPLAMREPRVYALFRELEAAQERFNAELSVRDSTGTSLYDRIVAQGHALDRLLDQLNSQPRRP
jgi:hypothetical protein